MNSLVLDQIVAQPFPARNAVVWGDRAATYEQLHAQGSRVGNVLRAHGVAQGAVVVLALDTPLDALAAALGALSVGAVLVLLDPRLGAARAQQVLDSSGAAVLLGSVPSGAIFEGAVISPDQIAAAAADSLPPLTVSAADPAVIAYRSKRTGKLEGLLLSRASLTDAISFHTTTLKLDLSSTLCVGDYLDESSLVLALSSLAQGGTVCFAASADGRAAEQLIRSQQVSAVTLALAAVPALDASAPGMFSLVKHLVTFGDDLIDCDDLKQRLKAANVSWHNYFGFPEFQFVSTIRHEAGRRSHEGRPAPQVQAFILDQSRQLVAVGLPGQLYVSGSGVLSGFASSVELQSEQFCDSPFTPGQQLYRTGYTARWLPNRRIEILGRIDGELIHNGSRIALAEIEAALAEHPLVSASGVVERTTASGSLVTAFVVSADDLLELELESFLAKQLGPNLPPIGFVQLDRLPRTADGQIDRQQLAQLPALDSVEIMQAEQRLRALLKSDDLALVVRRQHHDPSPLHLSDVLPRSAVVARAASSAQTAAQTTATESESDRPLAIAVGAPLRDDPGAPPTLVAALVNAAERYPTHGVRYIDQDGLTQVQSYPALLDDARQILGSLRASGLQPGEHVLFQLDRNEDFVPAFWACVLGGFVAVPLSIPPTYDPDNAVVAKLHNAWTMLNQPVLLSRSELVQPIGAAFAALGAAQPRLLPIEGLRGFAPDTNHHAADPEDTVLLLLTSGSTGVPKGVVLNHRNIISRSRGSAQLNHFVPEDVSLNWMPLDHVGGIVMFHIRDVCTGCDQIQVKTERILQDPVEWLNLIEQYRATVTWSPNFAFALINDHHDRVNAVQRDLSSMRFILNGGEAVNARTARTFLRLLKPHGLPQTAIHPAYGMSETSSGITYSDALSLDGEGGVHDLDQASLQGVIRKADEHSTVVTFVEVGQPIPGVAVRIVDGDNQLLREGMVGRLQAQGLTITSGYYQNPALNQEVFTADGWFTTGDLGFLLNGRLTITGREKDVIIVNGVNYHSHEIEAIAEEVEGVEVTYTAACAVRNTSGATEGMVLFFCSRYAEWDRQMEQASAIRQAIAQKAGLSPTYVLPVEKDTIPKTAIGKIQRTQLSQQFAAGAFADLTRRIDLHTANEHTIPDWFFTRVWSQQLPPIARPVHSSDYLVFTDDTPLSRALLAALRADRRRCVEVRPGPAFAQIDEQTYTIDPRDGAQYRQLIAALKASGRPISDYIHLLGYGEYSGPVASLDDLRAAQEQGVYSVLRLVQALAQESAAAARLTVVTSYAQAADSTSPIAAEKASIMGLLKTIPLELDWLTCRHIDLDIDDPAANSEQIVRELALPQGNAEVAYRQRKRLVPGLSVAELQPQPEQPLVPGGLYLITGGLGGIGSQLARWLASNYQARLILVGSTQLPESATSDVRDQRVAKRLRAFHDLQASGAEILYQSLDISDPEQIRAAIAQGEARWNLPLSGVFHLAGEGNLNYHWTVMDQHRVAVERLETFEMMFQPKVYGTWSLHQALKDRPGILFVASSSVSSFFGGTTFCAYSAANSFLDSYAVALRRQSHPRAVCLNWSMWDNLGMSADNPEHMRRISEQRGYQTIGAAQGINAFLIGAAQSYEQLVVGLDQTNPQIQTLLHAPFAYQAALHLYLGAAAGTPSRDQVKAALGAADRLPLEIYQIEQLPRLADGRIDLGQLERVGQRAQREALAADAPTNEIEQRLLRIWQEVLGKTNIGIHDNFFALGGHSLLATQLVSRLRESFNLELRLHQLFAAPTIVGLADAIVQAQMAQIDESAMAEIFAEVDRLSPEELDQLLGV